ncbi:MAG TPA: dephospho-CoA kinase [Chloroflexi bacterium]|nr:dephospho-CoA kinase [Chloroflexota bacterium]
MSSNEATSYAGKLIVGLTGNIATGKTAVMRLAAEQGALTIDADKIVHELMDNDANMQAAIAVAFGPGVRREDGRINRRALSKIVFNDPQALADLEAMVHPAVRRELDRRLLESEQTIVFVEAIKLLEGDIANACHQIWVTRCAPGRQLERLRVCRGMETEEAKQRIKSQSSQEEKVARADVVIDTNGLMKDTELQFNMAWSRLPDPAAVEDIPRLPLPDESEPPLPGTEELTPQETAVAPPPPKPIVAEKPAPPPPMKPAKPVPQAEISPDEVQVRRARPSDIPSILLLIQRATDGRVKMKRKDLLLALSERGYFLGQAGAEIHGVAGYYMDSQVARVDQIYFYPPEMTWPVGNAILQEIEQSAFAHMGQIIVAFLPPDAPDAVRRIFAQHGYESLPKETLANNWQLAIDESQPESAEFVIKIMNDIRKVGDQ